MKKFIVSSLIVLISVSFSGELEFDTPSGTVKIADNLYMDQTEVSNKDWRDFMNWNKIKYGIDSEKYLSTIPNASVWQNKVLEENYLEAPQFNNYPVVGISYEQAVSYCDWRTNQLNESLYRTEHKLSNSTDLSDESIPTVFKCRIPTKKEWETISTIDYSEKTKKLMSKKRYANNPLYNIAQPNANNKKGIISITTDVKSFWPNEKGVYNLIGNVAEMIQEKGVAKGGSWKQTLEEINAQKEFNYTEPNNWVGFRCVCEKIN